MLRAHRAAVLVSIASMRMLTVAILVVILMVPVLLQNSFGRPSRAILLANLAATLILCFSTMAVGMLVDRFGVMRTAVPMGFLLVTGTYALFIGATSMPEALLPLYIVAGAGVGVACVTPIAMVRAFSATMRFSGLSFSYNIAYAVFGGLTSVLVSWLAYIDRVEHANYVPTTTMIGLIATILAPVTHIDAA